MAKDKNKDKDKDKKKKKKNKKEAPLADFKPMDTFNTVKTELSDNTLLYTVLGVSAGLVLALAFGTERGREIVDRISAAVNDFIEQEESGDGPVAKAVKAVKDKDS